MAMKILALDSLLDGRIAEVCRAGFVDGPLHVPTFVLEELRSIADSGDLLKRARARRALAAAASLESEGALVSSTPDGAPDTPGAEPLRDRTIRLAALLGAWLVTTERDIAWSAAEQGVRVLDLNKLARALRPVVLPGEHLTIRILKEGREPGQGIGYLDDGTMVIVEGWAQVGSTVQATVTSVLQTVAGNMIFATLVGEEGPADAPRYAPVLPPLPSRPVGAAEGRPATPRVPDGWGSDTQPPNHAITQSPSEDRGHAGW